MQQAKITLELYGEDKKCTNVLTYHTGDNTSWITHKPQNPEDIRLLVLLINVLENWSNQERCRYIDKLRFEREERELAKLVKKE